MHTSDMLKPLDGLHLSGWVAEGAGCILGGGAEKSVKVDCPKCEGSCKSKSKRCKIGRSRSRC
eukprot:1022534-Prorocentrum_minimum.AAC.2